MALQSLSFQKSLVNNILLEILKFSNVKQIKIRKYLGTFLAPLRSMQWSENVVFWFHEYRSLVHTKEIWKREAESNIRQG